MSESWREVLDEFDVETTPTDPPADREGDWFQLLGVFGTVGFMRLITDGDALVLQLAPPAGVDDFVALVEHAGWNGVEAGPPALFERDFPAEKSGFRDLWIALAQVGDSLRDDDADAFFAVWDAAIESDRQEVDEPTDDGGQDEDETDDEEGDEKAAESTDESEDQQRGDEPEEAQDRKPGESGGAFETIGGADAREPLPEGAFEWVSERTDDAVEVALGFGDVLEPGDYQRLQDRLVRNLRGKYDVDAEVDDDHDVTLRLPREPGTRVALTVFPDRGVSRATAGDVEGYLDEYFDKLEELSGSGIDPLVFLGVTSSRKAPSSDERDRSGRGGSGGSAFETIGDEPSGGEDSESEEETTYETEWVVDDDEPDEEEGTSGVVLGVASEPDPDDPLEPGRFDDPRLRGPDATTSLVDVVMRHPGYSDRRVGQVLGILLSIEYSTALELINKAPTVIAWGVARDRAQTMKTVIEGAGGKVYLAEPGEFHEE